MNGSSRSLIRALNNVADHWKDSANEDKISSEESELFEVISLFNEKHNDLQSIKQSVDINGELFRIYNGYIKPASNLPREIMFLEILIQLLPILIGNEINLWSKTYLKPAVDSAGYDIQLVLKSREFIRQLSMKTIPSRDPLLIERRDQIALIVMDTIIQLYIGQSDERYNVIGLHLPKENSDNQLYYERIRYMKKNCEDLLHEYGLKKTKEYFSLINRYFKTSSERLDMLTLLLRLVSSHTLQVYQIVDTDLFYNLLRSLLYDYNESILLVSLSLLVMLIPQVCNKMAKSFPDLLVIYIRLANWELFNEHIPNRTDYLSKLLDENFKLWDLAEADSLNDVTPTNSKIELDILHFITLLYGLFPLNLSKFCQSPFNFLINHPTEIFKIKLLSSIMENKGSPRERNLELDIIDTTREFLRSFSFHPNFLQYDKLTLQNELENPLLWLLKETTDNDLRSEEISLECLSFNPHLVINAVHGHEELARSSWDKPSSDTNTNTNNNNNNQFGFIYTGTGESNAGSLSNSRHVSRKSSFATPTYLNLKDITLQKLPISLQHLNSKLSNQIGERKSSISDIKFKDVNFDEGLMEEHKINENENEFTPHDSDLGAYNRFDLDVDGSQESKQYDRFESNQLLSDMFSAHEKLYLFSPKSSDPKIDSNVPARDQSKNTNPLNEKVKNELLQRPITSPTTSLETASVHRKSISGTISNVNTLDLNQVQDNNITNNKFQHGTALEYYHRELLLMKNELEFSNYMRDLNKTHYIKLKLKLNKLSKQTCLHDQSIEHKNNKLKIDSLKLGYNTLTETLKELKLQLTESRSKFKDENSILFSKIKDLENENYKLKTDLKNATTEQQLLGSNLSHSIQVVLPEKEFEVNRLKTKLSELEQMNETLNQEIKLVTEKNTLKETKHLDETQTSSTFNLSEQEKQIYNLKNDILMLNDKNLKISQELIKAQDLYDAAIKSYESKLSSSKGDLTKNISTFTSQYERRIQELAAIILKYEGLLDEKNSRIAQFSTSKPIEINNTKYNDATKAMSDKSYDLGIPQARNNASQESYELESKGRETPTSVEGMYSGQPDHAQLHQNYVSSSHFPPQTAVTPIVRGRGGIQKRSKKHM